MYNIKNMDEKIKSFCTSEMIFDLYRLVDPYTYEVFDYSQGKKELLKDTRVCYEIFNRVCPCENCISRRSCNENKQYIKVEQFNGDALLILSLPIMLENRKLSLELIKNVTDSMVVASEYHKDNVQITQFIKEFNDIAVKDSFTGLYNKGYIHNKLEALINSQRNSQCFVTGVSIDVDNFKKVNDNYGHGVGDIVLQHIAAVIKEAVNRNNGWAGRLGGDEFAMFFENKSVEEVEQICKRMSEKIEKFTYKSQKELFNVTITFGIESLQESDSCRNFLDIIDQAMYAYKKKLIKKP